MSNEPEKSVARARRKALENVKVVLVGTLYGGNVGSACRAMANCGVRELRLVAPDPDLTWEFARQMAVHATDVLDARRTFATLEEAVADCVAVAGTSRRGGLYRRHFADSREVAPELLDLAETGPVALVFGREDKGLLNEEVAQCTHLLRIPVDEGYTSINLAQAVLITAYEIFAASGSYVPPHEKSAAAPQGLKMVLTRNWTTALTDIGFMSEKESEYMMQGVHRIFSRGVQTRDDAAIMLGVARQALWAHHNPALEGRKPSIG
jgi:tRNA/rRNA methyltransferase